MHRNDIDDTLEVAFPAWELKHADLMKNLISMGLAAFAMGVYFGTYPPNIPFVVWFGPLLLSVVLLGQGIAGRYRPERLIASRGRVEIRRPYLFYPSQEVPVNQIHQLYVYERDEPVSGYNPPETVYALKARLINGQEVTLVNDFKSPIDALFIEQELERWLDIADVPVEGEYERPTLEAPNNSSS